MRRALVTWRVGAEAFRTYLDRATDVRRVQHAIRARGAAGVPIGRVVSRTGENRGHRWHLVRVHLTDVTTEVCDGRPSFVDRDPRYWIGVVRWFCPWAARPVRLDWVVRSPGSARRPHGPAAALAEGESGGAG
jgi:hypothetical protein